MRTEIHYEKYAPQHAIQNVTTLLKAYLLSRAVHERGVTKWRYDGRRFNSVIKRLQGAHHHTYDKRGLLHKFIDYDGSYKIIVEAPARDRNVYVSLSAMD